MVPFFVRWGKGGLGGGWSLRDVKTKKYTCRLNIKNHPPVSTLIFNSSYPTGGACVS
jgi:hypothetical protein